MNADDRTPREPTERFNAAPGDELEQRIADYLAGEMSEPQAAEFRRRLEQDPALARRVRELQAAAAALDAGLPDEVEADRSTQELTLVAPTPLRRTRSRRDGGRNALVWSLRASLRYAAAILLAFGAGFYARGWSPAGAPPGGAQAGGEVASGVIPSIAALAPPEIRPERLAQVSRDFPGTSSFSRALLLLARPG